MTMLKVILDIDHRPSEADWNASVIGNAEIIEVVGIPDGTANGKPAVAIIVRTPDGETFFCQTTMALFQTAAAAFIGRYGDVT